VLSERAWCFDEARACLCRTRTNAFVFGAVRCLDVEGDERRRASSAEAARKMKPCLAETKESNRGLHGKADYNMRAFHRLAAAFHW